MTSSVCPAQPLRPTLGMQRESRLLCVACHFISLTSLSENPSFTKTQRNPHGDFTRAIRWLSYSVAVMSKAPSPFLYHQKRSEAGTQLRDLSSTWFGCVV